MSKSNCVTKIGLALLLGSASVVAALNQSVTLEGTVQKFARITVTPEPGSASLNLANNNVVNQPLAMVNEQSNKDGYSVTLKSNNAVLDNTP